MDINAALRQFEATEANIAKLKRIFQEMGKLVPSGISFGSDSQYDDLTRSYMEILSALPTIDGLKPDALPIDLNQLAQWRMDAQELGEPSEMVAADEAVELPLRQLEAYEHKLRSKRRPLIRKALTLHMNQAQRAIDEAQQLDKAHLPVNSIIEADAWDGFKNAMRSIDILLGSSLVRPPRWNDLHRHLGFGMLQDLRDIIRLDWPEVSKGLEAQLYADDEPIPVSVADLGTLAAEAPEGTVIVRLKWDNLSDDDFERLIFTLLTTTDGYENPEWLTRTNAADRGRDLSVYRTAKDLLAGSARRRVIVQCKHWLTKSISLPDVSSVRDQMALWTSPKVDILVIASTGRFTTDAVEVVEQHNQGDRSLKIELWAESHLEAILAKRPDLVAQFRLR